MRRKWSSNKCLNMALIVIICLSINVSVIANIGITPTSACAMCEAVLWVTVFYDPDPPFQPGENIAIIGAGYFGAEIKNNSNALDAEAGIFPPDRNPYYVVLTQTSLEGFTEYDTLHMGYYTVPNVEGNYTVVISVEFEDPTEFGHGIGSFEVTGTPSANRPPAADVGGPYSGVEGQSLTFDGSGSKDPDRDSLTYTWKFGDGTTGEGVKPSHVYERDGAYTVELTVSDGSLTDTDSTMATIDDLDPEADFTASPTLGTAPLEVAFNDQSTSYDGIASWSWSFGDGGTSTQKNPIHKYTAAGKFTVSLTVSETDGDEDTKTQENYISVGVANQPPTAYADGPYTGEIDVPLEFDGSGSYDPDGVITSYSWDFGDGDTGTGVKPRHSYKNAGTYTVALTVTDDGGSTATDTTTATITLPANEPPVADADGPYVVEVDMPVNFDGSGSYDPDGAIVLYEWDFGDGSTSTEKNPTHIYSEEGMYTVTLTVTDNTGLKGIDTTTATIKPPINKPPIADADGPYNGEVDIPLEFDGSGSYDPDGVITSYSWDFGDGDTGTGVKPRHSYKNAGTYTVVLTVTDDGGSTATDTTTATISAPGVLPPSADFTFSPPTPTTADDIQFTDKSSDPDGVVVSWLWDFGDGATSRERNPKHKYADDGTYSVKLIVKDDDDALASTTGQVIVLNVPPFAGFSYFPTEPTDLDDVVFTDASSDPDGTIVSWLWEFGDGSLSSGQNPGHSYVDDGTFSVTLTVTDDDGALASTTKQVIVLNVPPTASFTYSPAEPTDLDDVAFTDASSDPDGVVVSLLWDFGDGFQSSDENPSHVYADDGTYIVTFTVTDDDGTSATATRQMRVLNVAPTADFTYSTTALKAGEVVLYEDVSNDPDGSVVSWLWDFGDGATSTEKEPTHAYGEGGTYTVTLIVEDDDGKSATVTRQIKIKAVIPPSADFACSPDEPTDLDDVTFTDASSDPDGVVVSWLWDFGDGTTSTERNPKHKYAKEGTYNVSLTAKDDDGASATTTRQITVLNVPPTAGFTHSPATPSVGEAVQFTDTSSDPDGVVVSWLWDFGDGTTSILTYPSHRYSEGIVYTVTLTVYDDDGASTNTMRQLDVQKPPSLLAQFQTALREPALLIGISVMAVMLVMLILNWRKSVKRPEKTTT